MPKKDPGNIVATDVEVVDINTVKLHPFNARRGDIPAIMLSLQRFGQQKPVVVDAEGLVVAGNHTVRAAQKLGWKTIAIVQGGLEGDDSTAYLLADNRSSDRAKYKNTELGSLLQEQMDLGNLEGTGFNPDDVDDVLAAAGAGEGDGPEPGLEGRSKGQEKPSGAPTGRQPIREVVMMMPKDEAIEFGGQVAALQKHYGTNTVVATVQRGIAEMAASIGYTTAAPDEDEDDDEEETLAPTMGSEDTPQPALLDDDEDDEEDEDDEDDEEPTADGVEDDEDDDEDGEDEDDDEDDEDEYVPVEPAVIAPSRPLRGAAARSADQQAVAKAARSRAKAKR